jgi:hypothetical protein
MNLVLANSTTYSPTVTQTTTFYARCVNPGNGCMSEIVAVTATVNAAPALTVTTNATNNTVCVGQNVTLNAAATGFTLTNIVWTSTNAQVQAAISGNTLNTTGLAAGTYTINVTANINGCPAMGSVNITVNANPVLNVTANVAVCAPNTYNLNNAIVGGVQTGFTALFFSNATGTTAVANPTTVGAGTYYIQLRNNATQCVSALQMVTVTVNAAPVLTVTNPAAVCAPATVNLNTAITSSTAGLTFAFFSDAAGTVAVTNPAAVGAGTFYIRATNTATGCVSALQMVTVTVNANPVNQTLTGTNFCPGGTGSIVMASSQTGVSYQLRIVGGANVGAAQAGTGGAIDLLCSCCRYL